MDSIETGFQKGIGTTDDNYTFVGLKCCCESSIAI